MTEKSQQLENIIDWKHLYFIGITKQPLQEVGLDANKINAIISMLNIQASISTGALLDPEFIINAKGTTPWIAIHVLLIAQNKAVFQGWLSMKNRFLYRITIWKIYFRSILTGHRPY